MAYRMHGSLTEAEDAVQEGWLHLSRSGTSNISNPGGWLTRVVARVCLNSYMRGRSPRFAIVDTSSTIDMKDEMVL